MPEHSNPCSELVTLTNVVSALGAEVHAHVIASKEGRTMQHEENRSLREALNALTLMYETTQAAMKLMIKDAFKAHEEAERTMAKEMVEEHAKDIKEIKALVTDIKDAKSKTEIRVLIWVIGVMVIGIGALLGHILLGG